MRILTIATMKGGVGKTATTHALGEALAEIGWRVLLVDVDPQASLTQAAGVLSTEINVAHVLREQVAARDSIIEISPNLFLLPGDIELATVELELVGMIGRETALRRALESISEEFDIVLIDTPPSLGLLTVNALGAADAVLIPTQPQVADLRGLKLFYSTVQKMKMRLNPKLEIFGILVTFHNERLLHHQNAMEVMKAGGLPMLGVTIGRSVRVAEAVAAGQSIVNYEPSHTQAAAYRQLAGYINQWLNDELT